MKRNVYKMAAFKQYGKKSGGVGKSEGFVKSSVTK